MVSSSSPPALPPPDVSQVEHLRVPLSDLIPNPDNYNQHPPEQIADLKESLRRFGQVRESPVRRAANAFMLIAGHGITHAAHELVAEDPSQFAHLSYWDIAVVPPHWTDLDARAYMVADNKLSEKSDPDRTQLARLLQEQKDLGFALDALGSSEEDLDALLAELGDELLAQEKLPEPGDAEVRDVAEKWGILIECRDEQEQVLLLERFQEEGIQCRALVL